MCAAHALHQNTSCTRTTTGTKKMPPNLSHSADLTGEAIVLHRALRDTDTPRYTVGGTSDGEVRALATALNGCGWRASEQDPQVLLVIDTSLDSVAALEAENAPAVVAVRQSCSPIERGWPGWDARLLDNGYEGCLRTEKWSLYVVSSRAEDLGPALSFPPLDSERWSDGVPTESRAALTQEIVFWRTAALSRWAQRAAGEPTRTNKDLENELAHAKSTLQATQKTLSWRVTAPLRRIQTMRLRGSRR